MRRFAEMSAPEILALAISNEEEDSRVYADFAHTLRDDYPSTAKMFSDMAEEEAGHRRQLIDTFIARFGDHIPLVRRQDVKGNPQRRPHWMVRAAGVEAVRAYAAQMERDAERFYRTALNQTTDAGVRRLLGDLADAESRHEVQAAEAESKHLSPGKTWAGRSGRATAFCAADNSAGIGRAHGRIGLHASTRLCSSVRHSQPMERFPGWASRVARSWHIHGICGSFGR